MANGVVKVLDAIGHGFKVVFADGNTLEQRIVQGVQVAEDAGKDAPVILADVAALTAAVAGGKAIEASLVAALTQLGTNPVTDMAVIAQLALQLPHYKTYLQTVEVAFTKLFGDLKVDEAQIAAVLKPAPVL